MNNHKICLRGGWILTMEEGRKPFRGDVWIEGERIRAIVPEVERQTAKMDSEPAEIIDARDMAVMPGLINAHQHSPMSLLRCFSDDRKLMDWLENKMLPAEAKMTEEDIYWGAKLAMAEMIRSGTTAFADMYIHMHQIARAVEETGMRASLTRGLVFLEDDGGRRMQEAVDLIEQWTGKANGRITTMIGPHAPFTCPPEALDRIIRLAGEHDWSVHIHLAETVEETAIIRERYGMSPTEYLVKQGLMDGLHVLLAHGVHLSGHDVRLLKGMRGGVAHNPVSNQKLGCGIAPVSALRAEGVTVGLGTDGAGSAASLDLFGEVKSAARLQKLAYGDPTRLTAGEALRMATVESAKLLRIEEQTGTLVAGKQADVILIDLNKPHLHPRHNLESLLAYSATGADVDTVFVAGRCLMRKRELLTINEPELYREAEASARRITEGI